MTNFPQWAAAQAHARAYRLALIAALRSDDRPPRLPDPSTWAVERLCAILARPGAIP